MIDPAEVATLREQHYNAEVVEVRRLHDDLMILRAKADGHAPGFLPGQYTVLGLGNWESRVVGTDPESLTDAQEHKLVRRAYSFSCSMLSDQGELIAPERCDYLEFYITLIRHADEKPPGLTPRLFGLSAGDRLFLGQKTTGHYTLEAVEPEDDVVFVATGTGEAPHNAMVAHLLDVGHQGRLISVTCARLNHDLGYLDVHRALERKFSQYRYLTLTTREVENLDPNIPGYVGKRYLQDYIETGNMSEDANFELDPARTHVFLCGNPRMIGAPRPDSEGASRYPNPRGLVEVLEGMGFSADDRDRRGNIHFEKYW